MKTLRRKFGRFRLVSMRARGIFGWSRWGCCKVYRQQGVKQFSETCIARRDKKCTKNLSKIYLRTQSKFTKSSERLCSVNVVLSYWLERPHKLNYHQSFVLDRETFPRDKTLYLTLMDKFILRRFVVSLFKTFFRDQIKNWTQKCYQFEI